MNRKIDSKDFLYDHQSTEKKWEKIWRERKLDEARIDNPSKPFYNLMMFPYPSAEGLHVGNMYAFTGADIYGRFMRMQGYTVFEPIGLDGFGIHSENYALKVGRHPIEHAGITQKNFYTQLSRIGAMFDWSRTLETYDPAYYQWTQWLFVQMFKHGLAYRGKAEVNWCPGCKTVLSDEQVIEEKCERCGSIVEKKLLEQWFFRITAYAEKLLENLPKLDWTEKVKVAQKNWIGKQIGLSIDFPVEELKNPITVWTKYWETVFGVTFLVISPKHPVLEELQIPEIRRKNGVFTGIYANNPVNGAQIPIWIADYVLADVGTGAVMGVPAHDERDFAFAKAHDLPIIQVVQYKDTEIDSKVSKREMAYEGEGILINSEQFNGLDAWGEGKKKIAQWLIQKGYAREHHTYHLRDWLISRQRYWGPPIPMIYCETCAKEGKGERDDMPGWYTVSEAELPVILPRIEDYKPGNDGVAPLAKHKEFYETICPGCGERAVRETDVSDTFLDSSWYFLRYPSTRSGQVPFDPEVTRKWLPVGMYTGGAEHSVLHLMYSRFVTMALADFGYLDFDEPFTRFFAHGLVIKDGAKMSKSKGNVVNPDAYIATYGADALRLYLMFMGPFSQGGDFRDTAMEGVHRWVGRVWRLITSQKSKVKSQKENTKVHVALQRLIKKVGEDIERRHYNTAIASMMEFTNLVADEGGMVSVEDMKKFVLVLAPFAPYLAEELWEKLANAPSVHTQLWPDYDENALIENTVELVIQVGGKVRDAIVVSRQSSVVKEEVEKLARQSEKVQKFLEGKTVIKVIFVPGRLINFVLA